MNDFHYNFYQARLHRANNDIALAEKFCSEALKQAPNDVNGLTLFGNIKAALGHHKEAHKAYEAAARLEPTNTTLLVNLAAAMKDMGDFTTARVLLEQAIKTDKTFAPAYYTLAGIVRFTPGDPLIADFERLKKKVYGNPVFRCITCFALGKIYNDIGEWDLAFENYAEANQRRGERYDHQQTVGLFDAIKSTYTPTLLQNWENAGNQSNRPVFIIGMPRSGSSLIEDILSRSQDVAGLGEVQGIESLFTASYETKHSNNNKLTIHPRIDSSHLPSLGETYLNAMDKIADDAKRMVDKSLLNHAMVGFIRLLFPKSSIIHATRDPIDTCLSCYFQNFTEGQEYSFNLGDIARRYAIYADIMEYWESFLNDVIFTAPYEDLIGDKDTQIAKLFNHIGLSAPEADEVAEPADRAVATASAWQARQPIYKTSVKRWKNYEKHLGPLFEALDEPGFNYDGVG